MPEAETSVLTLGSTQRPPSGGEGGLCCLVSASKEVPTTGGENVSARRPEAIGRVTGGQERLCWLGRRVERGGGGPAEASSTKAYPCVRLCGSSCLRFGTLGGSSPWILKTHCRDLRINKERAEIKNIKEPASGGTLIQLHKQENEEVLIVLFLLPANM